jgi:folate-binding protein YgfZ
MDTALQAEISTAQQLAVALTGSGFAPLDETGWIRVTGSDRVRWLNGMVTNSVQALAPGRGCYNFALNSQGRIQGDLNTFAPAGDPDALLLETARTQVPALLSHLEHFIIMDDVELADITDQRSGLVLMGPHVGSLLQRLKLNFPDEPLAVESADWSGSRIMVIRAHSPLVAQFELWGAAEAIASITTALSHEAPRLFSKALKYVRLLEGTPCYGTDIRNTDKAHDLPQETAMAGSESRALHFSKGCYLGQEIVERIRSRGNVHRTFSGFELTGELPAPGTTLQAEGKNVGEVTSVARIPLPGRTVQLALGYIRREALDRKLLLEYPGGTAAAVPLPYRAALPDSKSDI